MSAPVGFDLSRARRYARVDALGDAAILEILALAKAARAWVNRSAGQRLRRIEERLGEEA